MTESLVDALRGQEASWNARPLLRSLYESWFEQVCSALSRVDGRSIELGSGIATLPRTCPLVEATDVEPTPWVSEVVDAEALPYQDGALANLVLVDVFHHLARPARFLDEAIRALAPGGRIVVLDPYCSPVSTRAYGRFHHERTDLSAAPFDDDAAIAVRQGKAWVLRAIPASLGDTAALIGRDGEVAAVLVRSGSGWTYGRVLASSPLQQRNPMLGPRVK